MKKLVVAILIIAMSCAAAGDAVAKKKKKSDPREGVFRAAKLVRLCEQRGLPVNARLCVGYILGIMDMARFASTLGADVPWCFPENLEPRQALIESIAAVRAYVQARPEAEASSAAETIAAALTERYPCDGTEPTEPEEPGPEEPEPEEPAPEEPAPEEPAPEQPAPEQPAPEQPEPQQPEPQQPEPQQPAPQGGQ